MAVLGQNLARGSVPVDLTIASDLAFVFTARWVRAQRCADLLRPPGLSGMWIWTVFFSGQRVNQGGKVHFPETTFWGLYQLRPSGLVGASADCQQFPIIFLTSFTISVELCRARRTVKCPKTSWFFFQSCLNCSKARPGSFTSRNISPSNSRAGASWSRCYRAFFCSIFQFRRQAHLPQRFFFSAGRESSHAATAICWISTCNSQYCSLALDSRSLISLECCCGLVRRPCLSQTRCAIPACEPRHRICIRKMECL